MAMDMFLSITDVTGESQDSEHAGEMDVLAWSWGLTQSGSMHVGGGGGSGKVSVQDVSITKYVDKSSSTLMQKCCAGEHFENAKLTIRKAGGTPLEYWILEMNKVLITSISTGGSGGEDKLTENLTLNFQDYKAIYTPQKEDGTADASVECAFNIMTNQVT